MTSYYRVMLGKGSMYFQEGYDGKFIGADYGIEQDLTYKLSDDWHAFNREFIPIYLQDHPGKNKVAAGLACGMLWTLSKGMNIGDIVLCPDGTKKYHLGKVVGPYSYKPGEILPHRRQVNWLNITIDRSEMSDSLRHAAGSIGMLSDVTQYHTDIEKFLTIDPTPRIIGVGEGIEDPYEFGLEEHLQRFLTANWEHTELGKNYEILKSEEAGDGEQVKADNGKIDILAISKDKKTLLVIELKKGRASDYVVGQILRYMGYVKEELAEKDQEVKGIIIAHDDDLAIRRALKIVKDVEFLRYSVSFKLNKG